MRRKKGGLLNTPCFVVYRQELPLLAALMLIIFAVLLVSTSLISSHYTKIKIDAEFKQAIKGNKDVVIRDFRFFTSVEGKRYITNGIKYVADISIAGAEGEREN